MLEEFCAQGVSERIASDVVVAPFVFGDPGVVLAALSSLVDSQAAVTLYADGEGGCVVGSLTQLDAAARRFVFATAAALQPAPGTLVFVATLNGVKLQFACDWPGSPEPLARLEVALPSSVIKLQRRRYSRHDAPLGLPFRAEFKILSHAYELGVDDIALGGVGLRASPREATLLAVGRHLPRVRLLLGNEDGCVVDLVICSKRAWNSYLLGPQFHIGCRFVALPRAAEDMLELELARITRQRWPGQSST